jgi:biopolymer transport protein ExbD
MNRFAIIKNILRRRKRVKEAQEDKMIDSVSIGDMAFLLLIFFIVTSSFIMRQGIFISLPSPNSSAIKMQDNQLIEVYPEKDGFVVRDGKVTRKDLLNLLKEQKAKHAKSVLVIRMRDKVPYEKLVDTLSAAKESNMLVSIKNVEGAN